MFKLYFSTLILLLSLNAWAQQPIRGRCGEIVNQQEEPQENTRRSYQYNAPYNDPEDSAEVITKLIRGEEVVIGYKNQTYSAHANLTWFSDNQPEDYVEDIPLVKIIRGEEIIVYQNGAFYKANIHSSRHASQQNMQGEPHTRACRGRN